MSSIFTETILKAVSDYRKLLRRHLTQPERISKLVKLNLRQLNYKNEVDLYHTAKRIIQDIETSLDCHPKSYYSYSGAANFLSYLKNFTSNYLIEGQQVIHRAQKASRALLDTIQLMSLPIEQLAPKLLERINKNSLTIANYGSKEQHEIYRENLMLYCHQHRSFFSSLLHHFERALNE